MYSGLGYHIPNLPEDKNKYGKTYSPDEMKAGLEKYFKDLMKLPKIETHG